MNLGAQVFTYDAETLLKDAGLVAASAAATVGGSAANAILDLSAALPSTAIPPEMRGTVVIDVTALETATGNEKYTITLQASSSSSFASDIVNLGHVELGHTSVMLGGANTSTTGRYLMPFTTNRNGTTYRYIRLYTTVVGTIATGINYVAYIGKVLTA